MGSYLGDIAIDDVSMTPGCILMNSPGNYSVTLYPRVEADTYIITEKMNLFLLV